MKRDNPNVATLVAGVLTLAVGVPLLVGQFRGLPPASLAARASERIVTLEVAGMTCADCAKSVQSSLADLAGVSAATVRYPQRRAYVVCAPEVGDSALVGAVERAGPGFSAAVTSR